MGQPCESESFIQMKVLLIAAMRGNSMGVHEHSGIFYATRHWVCGGLAPLVPPPPLPSVKNNCLWLLTAR